MKKLLGVVVIFLFWCSVANAFLLNDVLVFEVGNKPKVRGKISFNGKEDTNLSNEQNNALHLAKNVLTKLGVTGVQKILNSIVFDVLKMIVVFPVEDETKLSNKDGQMLPDAKLLSSTSTAKDLAFIIHQDIGKGFLHAIDAKTKQRIGAEHYLKNGDIIKIVSTLSRG